jgi:hypothetical protein
MEALSRPFVRETAKVVARYEISSGVKSRTIWKHLREYSMQGKEKPPAEKCSSAGGFL